jgi:hypothetical protein
MSAQLRATSLWEMPLSAPRVRTQVIDLAGADPVHIGLHDHREQGLVDPPAPPQQAGEERPGPQPGEPQLQAPGRGRQHPWPVAVALGQPLGRPLMWGGADHLGELGLDQAW